MDAVWVAGFERHGGPQWRTGRRCGSEEARVRGEEPATSITVQLGSGQSFAQLATSAGIDRRFQRFRRRLISLKQIFIDLNVTGVSPLLRNSTSESNVHEESDSVRSRRTSSSLPVACRTLSDGAGKENYARRQLESEDSSYDSDYECSETGLPAGLLADEPSADGVDPGPVPCPASGRRAESFSASSASTSSSSSSQHEDVSRTVSDTLAAEFNEYVCVPNSQFQRWVIGRPPVVMTS